MTKKAAAYVYTGPDDWHGLVGQVLASLGYVYDSDGKEAAVRLTSRRKSLVLDGYFTDPNGQACNFGPYVVTTKKEVKNYLLEACLTLTKRPPSPWGKLTGVRPIKLVHTLLDEGLSPEGVRHRLCKDFDVADRMADLLVQVAVTQRPYVVQHETRDAALYVGIPYCASHCLYCSFPSRLVGNERAERLLDFTNKLIEDIQDVQRLCSDTGIRIDSIYVGGGTPTSLSVEAVERIMSALRPLSEACREWTVEAGRPDTMTEEKARILRACGVDRISINPQTMQQHLLDALGRRHTVKDIYRMFDYCRNAGFSVINMDFIAGLPGQTVEDMRQNLEAVCQLAPENVTIHTLALKKGAPLFRHTLREEIPPVQVVEEMVTSAEEALCRQEYVPYYLYRQQYMAAEFANIGYAKDGAVSRYNIEMMEERQTVLGVGPGSATKFIVPHIKMEKMYMPKDIGQYTEALTERMKRRRLLCTSVYEGVN